MSDKYSTNDYKKTEDKFISSFEKDKKYSKKAMIIGGLGLLVTAGDYYLSNKLGLDSLLKSFGEMNRIEIANNILLVASSLTTLYGGIIYGAANFLERGLMPESKEKIEDAKNNLKY